INTTALMQVQFHPDYTITPSVQFPVSVKCMAMFDVTIANHANSASMVMIESKKETTGALSGLSPEVYNPPANNGTDAKVFHIMYKPPAQWDHATLTFTAYTHFLVNPGYGAGLFRAPQNVTWEFTNGGCAETDGATTDTTT